MKNWYIAVVILGSGFKYAWIEWDDAVIRNLTAIESDFWNHRVLTGNMPSPDGSKACDDVLEQYFHTSRKGSEIRLTGFDGQLERREELDALIRKLELEKNQIDQQIKLFMKDSQLAVNDRYKVSWASVVSSRIDAKRLKADKPEIYREYLKQHVKNQTGSCFDSLAVNKHVNLHRNMWKKVIYYKHQTEGSVSYAQY